LPDGKPLNVFQQQDILQSSLDALITKTKKGLDCSISENDFFILLDALQPFFASPKSRTRILALRVIISVEKISTELVIIFFICQQHKLFISAKRIFFAIEYTPGSGNNSSHLPRLSTTSFSFQTAQA
jgi:hypothetical protein